MTIKNLSVTITGPDDNTPIEAMFELSREFRFLEWGILCSTKREGTARYPTVAWKQKLFEANRDSDMRLAQHVCGETARSIMSGRSFGQGWFDRVQINGFRRDLAVGFVPQRNQQTILPFTNLVSLDAAREFAANKRGFDEADMGGAFAFLFDVSGGRGVEPSSWQIPGGRVRDVGFAGGIGPENVTSVLARIQDSNPTLTSTWIDMESKVRTDEVLDLDKVRSVLLQVSGWMAENGS